MEVFLSIFYRKIGINEDFVNVSIITHFCFWKFSQNLGFLDKGNCNSSHYIRLDYYKSFRMCHHFIHLKVFPCHVSRINAETCHAITFWFIGISNIMTIIPLPPSPSKKNLPILPDWMRVETCSFSLFFTIHSFIFKWISFYFLGPLHWITVLLYSNKKRPFLSSHEYFEVQKKIQLFVINLL